MKPKKKRVPYRAAEESRLHVPAPGKVPWLVSDRACFRNRLARSAQTAFEAYQVANLQGKDGTPLHYTQIDCIPLDERALATLGRTLPMVARRAEAEHRAIQKAWRTGRLLESRAKQRELAKLRAVSRSSSRALRGRRVQSKKS